MKLKSYEELLNESFGNEKRQIMEVYSPEGYSPLLYSSPKITLLCSLHTVLHFSTFLSQQPYVIFPDVVFMMENKVKM